MKTGSLWPWGIAVGLGTVVAANMVMLHLASKNAPVMEREQYYEASLEHQATIDARRASDDLRWQADVQVSEGAVQYTLRNALGYPVTGLSGEVEVRRPDTARFDATLPLAEVERGVYAASLDPDLSGYVRLRARLEGGDSPWLDERRLALP